MILQQLEIDHILCFHLQTRDLVQDNPKAQKRSDYYHAAPSLSLFYELVLSQLEISLISNMPVNVRITN